jgi:hypothetical protein
VRRWEPLLAPSVLVWVGLFAAPFAWAAQHVAGVQLTISQCHDNANGPAWDVPVHPIVIATTAVAAGVAVLGGLAAINAWRATREAEEDDAPPPGRIHFLAVIGMTITPLFLAIILMSGLGSIFLPVCVQS